MATLNPRLADLADDDRQMLESWLVEFDEKWDEGSLSSRLDQIPPGSSWRLPALCEMVKIDLQRQWKSGRQVSLESYLEQYPELGSPGDVSADLIQAEYEVRRQFGAPVTLDDYVRRFPHQAEELARLITPGGSTFSRRSPAPGSSHKSSRVPKSAEPPQPPPEQFGRYRIIKRLGQGGMGSVYLAQDTHLQRAVALKVPEFGEHDDPEARKRFLEEARTAATLDHPYLCPVYDAGEIDGQLYLTMAYIEGQSLADLIGDAGWPQRQVAALVGKLALALQEAHTRKVVHRDLKPANIMIKTTGSRREPVIVDFGLARRENPQDQRLTKSGQVMGTLGYMAPEQIRGDLKEIGPACDIYALGVILYELLTGRLPFSGSGLAIAGQILTQAPLPPSTHRADLNPALEAICLKAMAKVIGDRYTSMAELAADLTGFLQSASATQRSTTSAGPPAILSPISRERPQPTGSNSLVGQFLDRLAGTNALPPPIPTPEPVASAAPLRGRRRPPWPLIVAARALGVMMLGVIILARVPSAPDVEKVPGTVPGVAKSVEGKPQGPVAAGTAESPAQTVGGKPPAPPATTPSSAKELASPSTVGTASTKGDFQPLFNGRNTAGWKVHPNQRGNWHVANGVLIGSGPALSHIYTERGDFTDFHLRLEARFNRGGSSGVYLRCPFGPSLPSADDPKWPDGYEATINNSRVARNITGGLYPGVGNALIVTKSTTVTFGQWFTLEVIADGGALTVLVDGRSSAYKFAQERLHSSGHIALQQYSPESVIEFRRIEIKELNRPDQKDPKEIERFPVGSDRVARVAFIPDGSGILSGSFDWTHTKRKDGGDYFWFDHNYVLRLQAAEANGRNLYTRQGEGAIGGPLAFSADGRFAASSDSSLSKHPILVWDLKLGKRIKRLMLKDKSKELECSALSFSADDRRVMAASTNGAVLSWDLATEEEQPVVTLEAGPIKQNEFPCAAFGADRQHLATGSQSGLVELWDPQSGKKLQTFTGHRGVVGRVACSADGRLILSAGSDHSVRLWDVASGKQIHHLESDDRQVRCIAFSPDNRRALSGGLDGPVHLWDLASGKEVCCMEGHSMGVNSVAFSPDGRRAVSGSDDTTVRLWQLPE